MVLGGLSMAALVERRKSPYWFVGWFWYLGMLMPVLGLVQVGDQAMADRYTYLPQIGLGMALAWGIWQLTRSRPHGQWVRNLAAALAIAILAASRGGRHPTGATRRPCGTGCWIARRTTLRPTIISASL